MTWFNQLMGIDEQTPDQVRAAIDVAGSRMRSRVTDRDLSCGYLEILSLADLRSRIAESPVAEGRLQITEIIADVQSLHKDAQNAGALFQVASQFNLLEMVSPSRTPEHGIGKKSSADSLEKICTKCGLRLNAAIGCCLSPRT